MLSPKYPIWTDWQQISHFILDSNFPTDVSEAMLNARQRWWDASLFQVLSKRHQSRWCLVFEWANRCCTVPLRPHLVPPPPPTPHPHLKQKPKKKNNWNHSCEFHHFAKFFKVWFLQSTVLFLNRSFYCYTFTTQIAQNPTTLLFVTFVCLQRVQEKSLVKK